VRWNKAPCAGKGWFLALLRAGTQWPNAIYYGRVNKGKNAGTEDWLLLILIVCRKMILIFDSTLAGLFHLG